MLSHYIEWIMLLRGRNYESKKKNVKKLYTYVLASGGALRNNILDIYLNCWDWKKKIILQNSNFLF